ncbi:MAG TPA: glycerate kinase [Actinophytocola sp.]|jgi:glycerate kinase|uniref:glycerate kinase family protein n=1 Tax=Actinophytocola sp. TaxID=1872138 RepID=UPI002DF75E71|nr:glycerate kinase [Actinophytocola sp.]
MRVMIAPDCFGGTLSATEVADAVAAGWRRSRPDVELVTRPLSDGGPGFVEVLHHSLGGELHQVPVNGPLRRTVIATWLEHDGTAYIESAQACGLHLVAPEDREPLTAHTVGVGEMMYDANDFDVHTMVVGLGGTASTDGGAGLFSGLNAVPLDTRDQVLPNGGGALIDCGRIVGQVDLRDEVTIIAATDVENPLLGEHGAARTFGPQKGADELTVQRLERGLAHWADIMAQACGRDVRDLPGAGAAGGLGAGLLALGARVESGAGLVRRLTGLDEAMAGVDLVITGEGSFDWQSLRGKLAVNVAGAAAERGLPCLVLAGQVAVGRRQAASVGVERAYSVAEHAGSVEASLADPAGTLAALAADVAAQWGT